MRLHPLGAAGILMIAVACAPERPDAAPAAPSAGEPSAIGRVLESGDFRATEADGNDSVRLDFAGRGPTLLFVLSAEQCTTCVGLPAEAVIARDWAEKHDGSAFVVVVGAQRPTGGYCSARSGLVLPVLWDSAHWAARQQLPTGQVNLVVVSPNGMVVSILRRTSATEVSRPIGRFLESLPVQWRLSAAL